MRKNAVCIGAAVLAAIGLVNGLAAQEGDVERGKELYYVHGCYGCHGFNGQTGRHDIVGTGSPILATEDLFITYLRLRADQAPLLPSTQMPNYPENSLSDDEARDIFAFVSSLTLNAPDADSIPAFEAILEAAGSE